MAATIASLSAPARSALSARLDELLDQRVAVFAESTATGGTGDAADRAGNVEAIIRLEALDGRIRTLREQLSAPETAKTAAGSDGGTVQLGSRVTVAFEDGSAEPFLVGLLEQGGSQVDVITPSSPLGRVLLGARAGDSLTYRGASGTPLRATLVDVSG